MKIAMKMSWKVLGHRRGPQPAYREARQVWLDGNNAGPEGGGMDQRKFGRGQDQRQPLAGGRHYQGRK